MKPLPLRRRMVSSVSGDIAEAEALGPDHWWRNVREPVRFEAGFGVLLKQGLRVFVEVGPRPILSSYVRIFARRARHEHQTPTRPRSARDPIENTNEILGPGGNVGLSACRSGRVAALPLAAYAVGSADRGGHTTMVAAPHPLPANVLLDMEWFPTVDPSLFPVARHKVAGISVFSATAYTRPSWRREVFSEGVGAARPRHRAPLASTAAIPSRHPAASPETIAEFCRASAAACPDTDARGVPVRHLRTISVPELKPEMRSLGVRMGSLAGLLLRPHVPARPAGGVPASQARSRRARSARPPNNRSPCD